MKSPKAYAVTPFSSQGSFNPRYIPPGRVFSFRASIVEDSIARIFLKSLVRGEGEKVTLGKTRLVLESVEARAVLHGDLESRGYKAYVIHFLTPVRFSVASTVKRRKPKFRLFPIPEHIFHSLSDHWNAFAPNSLKTPKDFPEWVQNYVAEVDFKLKPVTLKGTANRVFKGSVGKLTLASVEDNRYSGWLTRLLEYGRYLNVGTGRSIGLGVIDYKPLTE